MIGHVFWAFSEHQFTEIHQEGMSRLDGELKRKAKVLESNQHILTIANPSDIICVNLMTAEEARGGSSHQTWSEQESTQAPVNQAEGPSAV
jgi:hypothetical protein